MDYSSQHGNLGIDTNKVTQIDDVIQTLLQERRQGV